MTGVQTCALPICFPVTIWSHILKIISLELCPLITCVNISPIIAATFLAVICSAAILRLRPSIIRYKSFIRRALISFRLYPSSYSSIPSISSHPNFFFHQPEFLRRCLSLALSRYCRNIQIFFSPLRQCLHRCSFAPPNYKKTHS